MQGVSFVIPAGFEPTTHSLEGCCSIQLSYGTITHLTLSVKLRCKNNVFISFIQLILKITAIKINFCYLGTSIYAKAKSLQNA